MSEYETITSEEVDRVCIITLNRAQVHNAFNPRMISELTEEFTKQDKNPKIKVIILTGDGKSFSAGADLQYMEASKDFTLTENKQDAVKLEKLFNTIYKSSKPVVGRVNGAAFGGGVGLVSLCDVAVAIERAIFAFSEVNLGIMPAVISPYVIPKIGFSQATRFFLTGERIDAITALRIGLIHEIASGIEELDQKVTTVVNHLLASGPIAISRIKQMIEKNRISSFEDVRSFLINEIAEVRTSPEGKEGLKAFLEKRAPEWKKDKWEGFQS